MASLMRKVDYRLKRDFYPLLESDGFYLSNRNPREWVKVENGIGCGLMISPSTRWAPDSPHRIGEEGVLVEVSITYPPPDCGQTLGHVGEFDGVGSGDNRGQLQRTAATPRTPLGFEWDLGVLTADEAVADIIAAYKDAGRAFFALWTDPKQAWTALHAEYEQEYESDVGGVYIGGPHRKRSVAKIQFFAKVAFRAGESKEEFELLKMLSGIYLKELGSGRLGEPYDCRLRELELEQ